MGNRIAPRFRRKPMTKFTPPAVVRGSRIAEMVEATDLSEVLASRSQTPGTHERRSQERRFQPEACACGHYIGRHLRQYNRE